MNQKDCDILFWPQVCSPTCDVMAKTVQATKQFRGFRVLTNPTAGGSDSSYRRYLQKSVHYERRGNYVPESNFTYDATIAIEPKNGQVISFTEADSNPNPPFGGDHSNVPTPLLGASISQTRYDYFEHTDISPGVFTEILIIIIASGENGTQSGEPGALLASVDFAQLNWWDNVQVNYRHEVPLAGQPTTSEWEIYSDVNWVNVLWPNNSRGLLRSRPAVETPVILRRTVNQIIGVFGTNNAYSEGRDTVINQKQQIAWRGDYCIKRTTADQISPPVQTCAAYDVKDLICGGNLVIQVAPSAPIFPDQFSFVNEYFQVVPGATISPGPTGLPCLCFSCRNYRDQLAHPQIGSPASNCATRLGSGLLQYFAAIPITTTKVTISLVANSRSTIPFQASALAIYVRFDGQPDCVPLYRGVWNNTANYHVGEYANHLGIFYNVAINNINQPPPSNYWSAHTGSAFTFDYKNYGGMILTTTNPPPVGQFLLAATTPNVFFAIANESAAAIAFDIEIKIDLTCS